MVGLTGGIGCGKSAVAERLVAHGAALVDADAIAREVVAPGTDGLAAVVERFGSGVLSPDGTLDRPRLAAIVFSDPDARKALEAITHPAIGDEIARRMGELSTTDRIVVLDVPLMVESGRASYAVLIVVDADPEVAVHRAERFRGLNPDDVRRRQSVQASREQRLAQADYVIDNNGDLAALDRAVEAAWAWIETTRAQREADAQSEAAAEGSAVPRGGSGAEGSAVPRGGSGAEGSAVPRGGSGAEGSAVPRGG